MSIGEGPLARDGAATIRANAEIVAAVHRFGKGGTITYRGHGHFQIRGALLVNYYPLSKRRTAYVDATTQGRAHCSPADAVALSWEPPAIVPKELQAKRRGKHSRRWRRQLLVLDAHCYWCRKPLDLDTSTVDHVVPLARGGLDNANNRVLACEPCNKGRGHDMPEITQQQGATA